MASKTPKKKSYLTPNEVAELLMVSPTTIRQWSSEGKIRSLVTPGGHRRFMRADIEQFSRDRGLTLQLPSANAIKILIVDDNKDIVKYLTGIFDRIGDDVDAAVANNGYEAGHMVHSFQPHVVLLDIMMPGMDGIQVCQTIKQDPVSKLTRVVAMTGFYDDENVQKILDAGAEACLRKPFDSKTLLTAIGIDVALLATSKVSG